MKLRDISKRLTLGLIGLTLLSASLVPAFVHAATTNPAAAAKISFTFDDGLQSTYTAAAPTLQKYGLTGTDYVITGCVGMTTAPNTCHANTDTTYMTWAQVTALKSTYGWEIGSHTVTHPYLATKDATDGQPNVLTAAQVTKELTDSKTALAAHGIDAKSFSTPYGDYNTSTLAQIAKLYQTHRGFADTGANTWPNNEYLLYDFPVEAGVTVAQVEAKIDQAIAAKQWLILTFHNIKTTPSTNPDDYEYSTANLDAIAAYAKQKQTAGQIQNTRVSDAVVGSDQNLFTNGSFDSALNGWRSDNSTAVKLDSSNNGSYPSSTNSVAFTNTTGTSHLFSQSVSVNSSTTYMLKSFLNLAATSGGAVGYYIDEYDANGNWISGQYKTTESSAFVENLNFSYKPTSANVNQASLQVIFNGNVKGYVDNFQWFPLSSTAATNMVTGGTFDQGISGGWRTDATTAVTADAQSNGSPNNVVNSVKLTSQTTAESHLFSPSVAVSSTSQYNLVNYLNVKTLATGAQIAFYIDEYDASGNWVSGQYKLGTTAAGGRDISLAYTPSSANVKSASLQVIVTKGSGTLAYFDDSRWYLVK